MKRRQFMRYAGASAMAATGLSVSSRFQTVSAQSKDSLSIQYLGHTAFLFTGGGIRILANHFRALGCTAGKRLARLQGVGIAHDRQGGKRFGTNVAWRWTQGGIRVVHLGGAAAPIDIEQKILLGSPDVALIPVGGGPKAYNANEGKQAMETLRPKVMIPTHYRTSAADEETCDIDPLAGFLNLVEDMNIKQVNNNQLRLRFEDLPKEGTLIRVLNYKPALKA